MTAALQDLLARVEAATGPDSYLDNLIEEHFGDWSNLGGARMRHKTTGEERVGYINPRGPYTSSLDAALALAERLGLDVMTIAHEALERMGLVGWNDKTAHAPQIARYVILEILEALISQDTEKTDG